jgi:hypothetical protein
MKSSDASSSKGARLNAGINGLRLYDPPENIDPAKFRQRLLDHRLHLRVIANVHGQSKTLHAERLHFVNHRRNRIRRQRGDNNVRSRLCKRDGAGPANTTAAAGNNRRAAL